MDNFVSVIVPTFNERDNIQPLLEKINSALSLYKYEVVIIDDNSRDGTAELASSLADRYPVRVIVRRDKKGLASAVVDGFGYMKGNVAVVMDADLQHPPGVIPDILKAIESGADLAIGSRYVPGGDCGEWKLTRRIISKGAIFLAHFLLPQTRSVCDPMSGFFGLKKSVLNGANLMPTGYKILLEVLIEGDFQKVTEVPFAFQTRSKGESKLSTRTQIHYLKHLFSLMRRKGEIWRFLKFIGVGLSGVGVNEGVLLLTNLLTNWNRYVVVIPGIEVSIITNFILNDYFTFADRRTGKNSSFFIRLLKFNAVSLAGAAINFGIYSLLVTVFRLNSTPELLLANFVAIVIAFLWNYALSNFWTWK